MPKQTQIAFLKSPYDEQAPWPPVVGSRFHHPLFAWLGVRPVLAQHTYVEHEALTELARGRATILEIGVGEGASALALLAGMPSEGTLFLVDPFHLSRTRVLNATRLAAHRAVKRSRRAKVAWVEQFSHASVASWARPIDMLFLDGDHSEEAVWRDWNDWHRYVIPGGIVAFHDARIFPGGWTHPEHGPVKAVNALFRTGRLKSWEILREVDSLVVVQRQEGV